MKGNIFQSILTRKPKLNKFDLSHEAKMSLNMGKLYPILLQEVIPGDRFRVNTEILMRMAPMIAPVMHRINVYTHYFFVPNRLVWNEWEDFITGGEDGLQTPTYPKMNINPANQTLFDTGTLADYFNVPSTEGTVTSGQNSLISALPFRGYQLIYNEYFRDQNLETKIVIPLGGGTQSDAEAVILGALRDRAWEKDYFTSALPWAQRGASVNLPTAITYKAQSTWTQADGTPTDPGAAIFSGTALDDGTSTATRVENIDTIGTTINDLRQATKLQEWLEKSARGGSRYIEQILSHFGVRSSDSRLQRPEYLGGGRSPMIISEVLQTSESDINGTDPTPQGNMAGHGISVGRKNGFSKSFEEHGYIIGLMSVIPKTTYQQGLERHWVKYDKFDVYWPEFAHLGEQEILNREIYQNYLDNSLNDTTFGYQSRYAEYKYKQSSVHGDFRESLDFWQMGRIFSALPPLNEAFVKSDPTNRIFAVIDGTDTLYAQIYNKIDALRPMPYHAIPSL